jgi:hypothetical protein
MERNDAVRVILVLVLGSVALTALLAAIAMTWEQTAIALAVLIASVFGMVRVLRRGPKPAAD